jgi:hypothetical protein
MTELRDGVRSILRITGIGLSESAISLRTRMNSKSPASLMK